MPNDDLGPRSRSRLSSWADLAEIISSVAVLVTLVALFLQMRENTAVIRASAFQESTRAIDHFREMVASDAELNRLFYLYSVRDTDALGALEPADAHRLTLLMNNLFGSYESAYYAWQFGILNDLQWLRFQEAACGHAAQVRRTGATNLSFLTAPFREHLQASC